MAPSNVNAVEVGGRCTIAEDIACPSCGYDLRGIEAGVCPECGLAVERGTTSRSRIPWEHSKRIGIWRAYWRTNWMVLLRPGAFAEEMDRPVGLGAARRFRHVTVLAASFWSVVWAGCAFGNELRRYQSSPFLQGNKLSWLLEGVCVVTALASVWLFFLAVSGVGSYFFHPKQFPVGRQNRAIALSYYASAPLAWIWLPAVMSMIGWGLQNSSQSPGDVFGRVAEHVLSGALIATLVVGGAFWIRWVNLLESTTRPGNRRAVAFLIYLPVSCAVLFGLCAGMIVSAVLVSLMLLSLT